MPLTARTVVGALSLVSNLALNVVITGIEVGMAIKAGSYTLRSVLTGAAQVSKGIRVGGMVGLAINVALTWSFFIYAAVENGASAGSPELNKAFFEAVAATLVAVFLLCFHSPSWGYLSC